MNASDILRTLYERGVSVRVEGSDLKLRPSHALDAVLRQAVRAQKAELIGLLTAKESQQAQSALHHRPVLTGTRIRKRRKQQTPPEFPHPDLLELPKAACLWAWWPLVQSAYTCQLRGSMSRPRILRCVSEIEHALRCDKPEIAGEWLAELNKLAVASGYRAPGFAVGAVYEGDSTMLLIEGGVEAK